MVTFPDTEKKLKNKISSYRSALNKELKEYDHINDGAGKRYLLFPLYFVLNDLKKSEKYFEWYKTVFKDDGGEPVQKLCWSVKDLEKRKKLFDESRTLLNQLSPDLKPGIPS